LRGDASVRAYFRLSLNSGEQYMLAYYPPELREQARRFLRAHEAISAHVRVPAIVRHCPFAIGQEDVGDFTLFDLLHQDREKGIQRYQEAVSMLVEFQRSDPAAATLNAPFDAATFGAELQMTLEYYVLQLMGAPPSVETALIEMFNNLSHKVAHHPYVLTHRDYHGQNIHIINDTLYMIDYQDLRMGPDTYDLASLLRDRGVARILGRDAEDRLIEHYALLAGAGSGLRQRYFETLLQRSIKILGTFARQAITRGRKHYLEFIPPTLESIRVAVSELPAYSSLLDVFPLDYSLTERGLP
jgi:aminoglycoside/choline kinase family phosphotransferase